jgi:hypothetical protein
MNRGQVYQYSRPENIGTNEKLAFAVCGNPLCASVRAATMKSHSGGRNGCLHQQDLIGEDAVRKIRDFVESTPGCFSAPATPMAAPATRAR